jgi:hypothetical protein
VVGLQYHLLERVAETSLKKGWLLNVSPSILSMFRSGEPYIDSTHHIQNVILDYTEYFTLFNVETGFLLTYR